MRLRGTLILAATIAGSLILGMTAIGGTAYASFKSTTVNPKSNFNSTSLYDCGKAAQWANAYFHFGYNEDSGSTVIDEGPNKRNGSYIGDVTKRVAGNCANSPYISLSTNSGDQVITPQATGDAPNVFTLESWFRTTTPGGKIIGWGSAQTDPSPDGYDRQIYMADNGQIRYGLYPYDYYSDTQPDQSLITPGSYNDGKWHMVATTTGPSGSTLYIDGKPIVSDSTMIRGELNPNGYWRIGFDSNKGWEEASVNPYYTGDLDNTSVWYSALSASTIASHYTAGR